jgi:hypothetical protein
MEAGAGSPGLGGGGANRAIVSRGRVTEGRNTAAEMYRLGWRMRLVRLKCKGEIN